MSTLILVSVHNNFPVPLPCLSVHEVLKALSGGVSTGIGETFWDITCTVHWLKFIFQKKAVSLFKHAYIG